MNRLIPGFLTSDTPEDPPEEQDPVNNGPPLTRSRSANLQAPFVPGPDSIAARGRRASRSPSPSVTEGQFFPPRVNNTSTMADDTVRALTTALQGMKVSSRKPDLPAFDSKNVEIWLKRVSNAYRRAGITDPQDKFAFVETKFSVDTDPRINEFIFGEGTAENWSEFEQYLRNRYGRSKAQQTAVILDGVQREGRLPSEMFAFVKDQIGNITIDDIVKEMVLRELPTDIRRTIHDKVKDLDGAATVKLADDFFDRNGKPIHKTSGTAVNAVEEPSARTEISDEDGEVNAVNRRLPNRNYHPRPQQNQTRAGPPQKQHRPTSQPRNRFPSSFKPSLPAERHIHSGRPTVKPSNLCRWHSLYGDKARTCEAGCDRLNSFNAVKGKAGRQA